MINYLFATIVIILSVYFVYRYFINGEEQK